MNKWEAQRSMMAWEDAQRACHTPGRTLQREKAMAAMEKIVAAVEERLDDRSRASRLGLTAKEAAEGVCG